jgi:hypothetical protein
MKSFKKTNRLFTIMTMVALVFNVFALPASATDTMPPTPTQVAVSNVGSTTATLQIVLPEAATYWYVLLNSFDAQPTVQGIKTISTGIFGSASVAAGTHNIPLTGLTPNTDYVPFVYAQDAANNGTPVLPYAQFTTQEGVPTGETIVESVNVDSTAKKLLICFSDDLSETAPDESKIDVKSGNNNVLAVNAFATSKISDQCIESVFSTALKTPLKLAVEAGAITDLSDEGNAAFSEITLALPKFPKLKSTTINSYNDYMCLAFDLQANQSIVANPKFDDVLSDYVQIAFDGKTYKTINADSSVIGEAFVEDNMLCVWVEKKLTTSKTTVKFNANILSFRSSVSAANGVLNSAGVSAAIDIYPYVLSTTVGADNKSVSVKYSETIFNASTETDKTKAAEDLVEAMSIERSDMTAAPISGVSITKDTLKISMSEELIGESNQLVIASNAVMDSKKNKPDEYESEYLVADEEAPSIYAVNLSKDRKTVTVIYDEPIFTSLAATEWVVAGTGKDEFDNTIGNDKLQYSANQEIFLDFVAPKVTLAKNTLTIKTTTALPMPADGLDFLLVNVLENVIKDAAGNTHEYNSTWGMDDKAPTATASDLMLDNDNKDATIFFEETVLSTSKTTDSASVQKALKNSISIVQGLTTVKLSDKTMSAVTVTLVSEFGTTQLVISGLPNALAVGNKIIINPNSLLDKAGNKSAKIEITVAIPD